MMIKLVASETVSLATILQYSHYPVKSSFSLSLEKGDLGGVAVKLVWSFKIKGKVRETGIIDDARNSLKSEEALAYLFVSVLCGAEGVF